MERDLFTPGPDLFTLETYTEDELKQHFGDAPAEPAPEPAEPAPVPESAKPARPAEPEQFHLIDPDPPWRKEWEGMPQFVQVDQTPMRSLLVHFESAEDIRAFERLVCQSEKGKTT